MNPDLWNYFRNLGCEEPPEVNERDGELFLRHLALCRECPGIDDCRERGCVMRAFLAPDKRSARIAMGPCPRRQARDARRRTERLFSEAALPPGLRECSLKNYVTTERGESVERAKNGAKKAVQMGSSLVLAGGVGTGKTHLAAAIVQAALAQGRNALFISAIGYLEHLKSTFEKRRTDLYQEMVDHVKRVSCLAIDDFGAEKPSEWAMERLYDVINARVERKGQTIVTTNFPNSSALMRHISSDFFGARRIASRLFSFGWIFIEGEDYRVWLQRRRELPGTIAPPNLSVTRMTDNVTDGREVTDKLTDRMTDRVTDGTGMTDGEDDFLKKLLPYFERQEWIDNTAARKITGKSPASAKRYLRRLTELRILEAAGVNRNRLYRLNDRSLR
jgi:DNA replication protein DnaC